MVVIRKISANPRDLGNIWRPRTQEHTGGFNPREVLDLQVNPNEDDDGLAHNSRNTTEDSESRQQADPEKRRERAVRELLPGLQHIVVKPEEMGEVLERSPRFEEENQLLESRLGVDLGARGLSFSAGAHRGTVRSPTGSINYGRGQTNAFGKSEDLEKAKRRYKGRRYSEDEESEDEEKKSKKKSKRKKKRSGKGKDKKAGGKNKASKTRTPKRTTASVDAAKRKQVDRGSKQQKFGHAMGRRFGTGSHTELPLRLRDPIAYARKLANEKHRRATGAMPTGMTHHRSSGAGVHQEATRGSTIGGDKRTGGKGTKMPSPPPLGTNMSNGASADRAHRDRILEAGMGDPLGTEDNLKLAMVWKSDLSKKGLDSLSRTEIIGLKKKIEALLRHIEKVTKATPENEAKDKAGATPNEETASAPQGGTRNDEKACWMFEDPTPLLVSGVIGKK